MFKKLKELEDRHKNLSQEIQDPRTVKDRNKYKEITKELSNLEKILNVYHKHTHVLKSITDNKELLQEEDDLDFKQLAKDELLHLEEEKEVLEKKLKLLLLPKDPQDEKNVILEIRAGAGGDESSLFSEELFRAYSLFCSSQNWKLKILNLSPGNAGGCKEVIASVSGEKVFSVLKYENGVHRVQRVPKTESQGRIHTSTITVIVLPEADKIEVDIKPKDLRVDVYRSSGHGGQSVNTTDSAVRVTHLPTGLIVTCQEGKSQHSNKEQALKVLYARLLDLEKKKAQDEASLARLSKIGRGNRSDKIRTYNFPQSRITDHRLAFTFHRLEDVMSGKLELMIDPLIAHFQTEALKKV